MIRVLKSLSIEIRRVTGSAPYLKKDPVIIFADPRSGSTFLAELICKMADGILIFEPFNIDRFPSLRSLGLGWRPQLAEDQEDKDLEHAFKRILNLKGIHSRKGIYSTWNEVKSGQLLVFKTVRIKGLLFWYLKHFHHTIRPIVLIRNPYAVIASQKKIKAWNKGRSKLQIHAGSFNHEYYRHRDFLSSLETSIQQNAAHWCLANRDLLLRKRPEDYISIYYEDLITNPEKTIQLLSSELGVEYKPEFLDGIMRPSQTTYKRKISIDEQLNAWKEELSNSEIKDIDEVLSYFDLKKVVKQTWLQESNNSLI